MSMLKNIFGQSAKGDNGLHVLRNHFRSANAGMKSADYGTLAVLGGGIGFSMTLAAMTIALADNPLTISAYSAPVGAAGMVLVSLAYDLAAAAKKTWLEIGWKNVPQPPAPPPPPLPPPATPPQAQVPAPKN